MDIYSYIKSCIHLNTEAFFGEGDYDCTYAGLFEIVSSFSAKLCALNLFQKRIILYFEDPYLEAISILAVLASGNIVVPVSMKYGEALTRNILEQADADLIVTDGKDNLTQTASCNILHIGYHNLKCLGKTSVGQIPEISEDDLAFIMFTSGTTGIPKGVMLTHKNVVSNLESISGYFNVTAKDRILIARPLYHIAVMTGELLYGLSRGAAISFYRFDYNPVLLLKHIREKDITVFGGTPTLLYHLARFCNNERLPLRNIVVSGERLAKAVVEQIAGAFYYASIYHVYGLTEASPRVAALQPDMFCEKVGSIGKPIKNVVVKIVGENGCEVSGNTVGELTVNGPNVTTGYWKNVPLTVEKIKAGWLYTGDMGYRDKEGYLYIVGRKDNMIIRSGMNIYPQEIENQLLQYEEFQEVLVYGKDDILFGQKICLKVVLNPHFDIDKAGILAICRKALQTHHMPAEIKIVNKLERNASGKIIRKMRQVPEV